MGEAVGEADGEDFFELEVAPFAVFNQDGLGVVAQVGVDARGYEFVYYEVDGVLPVCLGVFLVGEPEEAAGEGDVI